MNKPKVKKYVLTKDLYGASGVAKKGSIVKCRIVESKLLCRMPKGFKGHSASSSKLGLKQDKYWWVYDNEVIEVKE